MASKKESASSPVVLHTKKELDNFFLENANYFERAINHLTPGHMERFRGDLLGKSYVSLSASLKNGPITISSIYPWIYFVVRNNLANLIREVITTRKAILTAKRRREKARSRSEMDEIDSSDEMRAFLEAISYFPEQERMAILARLDGKIYREIGEIISPTAKPTAQRMQGYRLLETALKRLKENKGKNPHLARLLKENDSPVKKKTSSGKRVYRRRIK